MFVLAMLLHPECQIKAQEEIDAVVGQSRLPDFEDREHLPLVECIVQETLRFALTIPQFFFNMTLIPQMAPAH